ncbi:kelch-like protein 10 [Neosynchiropus ocellatus]
MKADREAADSPEQHVGKSQFNAVIKVGDVEFQVHKDVLGNCSEFFRALFGNWSVPDQREFTISVVSSDVMKVIIDFMCEGCVSVTEETLLDVIFAADFFNIAEMMERCNSFLDQHLSLENCISVWKGTKLLHPVPPISRKAFTYIITHFEELVSSEEFFLLTAEELTLLLERDELNVREEYSVFEAILRWVAQNSEEQKPQLAKLLSKVRLVLLPLDYISTTVITNDLVSSDPDSLIMIKDATQTIRVVKTFRPKVFAFRNVLGRPRLSTIVLLACGMLIGRSLYYIVSYDIRVDSWITVTSSLPAPCERFAIVFLEGFLYCIGGYTNFAVTNNVHRFDLSTQTWQQMPDMNDRRDNPAVTVLAGQIYAIGGSCRRHPLKSAERYRPEDQQWSLIAPMNECRSYTGCASHENMIYVCGGFNGILPLQSVECYCPEKDQWTMIASMMSRRAALGVIAHADRIYAVGGADGRKVLSTVEAYNPKTQSWKAVSPMLSPRKSFGIAAVEGCIYAVGGFNGRSFTRAVEFYSPAKDAWSVARNIKSISGACGCCAVEGLSNMRDYMFPRDCLPLLPSEYHMSRHIGPYKSVVF